MRLDYMITETVKKVKIHLAERLVIPGMEIVENIELAK